MRDINIDDVIFGENNFNSVRSEFAKFNFAEKKTNENIAVLPTPQRSNISPHFTAHGYRRWIAFLISRHRCVPAISIDFPYGICESFWKEIANSKKLFSQGPGYKRTILISIPWCIYVVASPSGNELIKQYAIASKIS